jgi:hypothetical protein
MFTEKKILTHSNHSSVLSRATTPLQQLTQLFLKVSSFLSLSSLSLVSEYRLSTANKPFLSVLAPIWDSLPLCLISFFYSPFWLSSYLFSHFKKKSYRSQSRLFFSLFCVFSLFLVLSCQISSLSLSRFYSKKREEGHSLLFFYLFSLCYSLLFSNTHFLDCSKKKREEGHSLLFSNTHFFFLRNLVLLFYLLVSFLPRFHAFQPTMSVSLSLSKSRHCLSSQISVPASKEKSTSPKNFNSPSLLRLSRLPLLYFLVGRSVPLFFSIFSSFFWCPFVSLFYFGQYLLKSKYWKARLKTLLFSPLLVFFLMIEN